MTIKKIPATAPLKTKDQTIVTWHLDLPVDFDIQDIAVPGAWAHLAPKLRAGQEVIARRSDLAWRVHLQVTEVGVGYVNTSPLSVWRNVEHKPETVETEEQPLPDLPANYKVAWIPGNRTFAVRTSDPAETVSQGHKTKLAAYQAAIKHSQKVLGVAA